MDKPTIFLIRNIRPEAYGGAESYQIELAKILKQNGYTPIIFTASSKLLELANKTNIKTVKAPYNHCQNWSGWRNLLLPAYIFWQLRLYKWYKKQIKKYHPTALNIQSRDEWIAATLAGKNTHTKVLWTDHIDFRTWVFQNINQKGKNLIGKYILKLSIIPQKIISISDYESNWIHENVNFEFKNFITIKNGVLDEKLKFKEIKTEPKSFCYVGRLINYKGIKELIDAFNLVSATHKNAILNIYGTGPDLERYQNMTLNNPNIIFHGYTDHPLEAMAKSQYFVLPSHYEGLSISLLEAAMMQKTIIATNVDGNPEIVIDKKTGIIVPPKNHKALANAMLTVLDDKTYTLALASNARRHYEQNFNFEKIVEQKIIPLLKGV